MLRKAYLLLWLVLLSPLAQATLQFDSAAYEVNESDGTVTITVTRVGGSDGEVSVKVVTKDGTAKSGKDYEKTTEKLKWDDGEAGDKTFTVNIIDDSEVEGDETFTLKLKNAEGASLGKPKKAEVTIIDGGTSSEPGTLQFSSAMYSVGEDGMSIDVIVNRVGGKDGAVTVDCASSEDSATAGEDYSEFDGTLSWDDQDDGDQSCTVSIFDDADFEGDETFYMTLGNATGGATIGDPDTAEVTIIDDDSEPEPGTLQFSEATYEVVEGEGIVATITVTRVGGSYGEASVQYATKDGSAQAGLDYIEISGTLSWGDGDTDPKTFTVDIIDDSEYEDNETFTLKLKKVEGATIGEPGTAEVTIIDDGHGNTLQFSNATYSVDEDGGSVDITVTRVDGKDGAVSVDYISSDGTATAGADYTTVSGTLNWGDQDDEDKTFTVEIFDDADFEGDETFNMTLENATGGADIGDPSTAKVTIIDDDSESEPGTLQFSSATYDVGEGDGTVMITVTRVDGSYGEASVKAVTKNDTAKSGKDYEKTTKKLKWDDGEAGDKTFTVDIIDDSKNEGDETFALKLKKAEGAELGKPKKAEVTIADNDQM
jgi:uncharacterized protein (DUF2249 family)